jgi:hypothetical protein
MSYTVFKGWGRLLAHINEVRTVPYYRRSYLETLRYTYAKWKFALGRVHSPEDFLHGLGIPPQQALSGYKRWRPLLEEMIQRVGRKQEQQGHQGDVSVEDGIVLYGIVRAMRPEYVIETGVAAGVSNSFINAALIDNGCGTLYSIELPPAQSGAGMHDDGSVYAWPQTGVGWAVPPEIRDAIGPRNAIILEDVRTALPKVLRSLPGVDLFFHDDLHTPDHMLWEYDTVWPHLRSNGVLLSDDSNFGWIRFCRERHMEKRSCVNMNRLTAIRKT